MKGGKRVQGGLKKAASRAILRRPLEEKGGTNDKSGVETMLILEDTSTSKLHMDKWQATKLEQNSTIVKLEFFFFAS